MSSSLLASKSVMLAPICDGDQVAGAILDYLYLYFQTPSPFELFFRTIERKNSDILTLDFYRYSLREYQAPFNLDYERYPDTWLSVTLAELYLVIQRQLSQGTVISTGDLVESLKLLDNKGFMAIEDWDLFESETFPPLSMDFLGTPSPVITCWLHRERVDYAVSRYYESHFTSSPVDERFDVRREKRVVNHHVHRAKRLGQAASLTFDEWIETLRYFRFLCAFCQQEPYEVLEHFQPIIQGGSSSVFNCIPSCVTCNALKGDRIPSEFAQDIGDDRIHIVQLYLEQKRQQWLKKRM